MIWRWWLIVVLGLACGSERRVDPNLRRGRELLEIKEPDAAVREFRLALKSEPKSKETKAMLLVALLRSDDTLATWYEAQILFERIRYLKEQKLESLDGFDGLVKHVTAARQALYDKGLDTRDTEDLWEVTKRAAEYSFEIGEDEEKDHASFVLALHGDDGALAYLVDRLKSEKADYVPELLARLGGDGEEALMRVASDPENLGRVRALGTLATLRERQAAEQMFGGPANVTGLREADLPEQYADALQGWGSAGLTRDQALYGLEMHDVLERAPLRVHWVMLDDDGAHRVLIVQGFDHTRSEIVTRFYSFVDGALRDLKPSDGPESLQLATEGPIQSAERSGAGIVIRQVGTGDVPVLKEAKRSSYKKGDHVRVRGNGKNGTIQGVDEFGLLLIQLDPPSRGVLTLTPGAVRGLEIVMQQRIGVREYEAFLAGDALDLKQKGEQLQPL